jgi:putative transposase
MAIRRSTVTRQGLPSASQMRLALVKAIKGRSSGVLCEEFPHPKSRLPTLWTNSYFVATVGGAPLDVVKQCVENQKNV